MDIEIAFLNGDIEKTIFIVQIENFKSNDSKHLVCKLNKYIYVLKQAFHQCYRKLG